jgi:hypothetical protein
MLSLSKDEGEPASWFDRLTMRLRWIHQIEDGPNLSLNTPATSRRSDIIAASPGVSARSIFRRIDRWRSEGTEDQSR